MRVVVVGYGMAGARVATELRARRDDLEIVVLGAEQHRAYNRLLLSNVLAGKASDADVALAEPNGRGVEVRLGVAAVAIDPKARLVSTSDGGQVSYDRLILATGAQAVLPDIPGLVGEDGQPVERVAVFRTLDDCRQILSLATRAREAARDNGGTGRALVLGGGLLGLEAARGLAAQGLEVTVLHARGHVMDRQLDPVAGRVLARSLAELGVATRVDAATVRVKESPDGIQAILADGDRLDADLIVLACGVRADTALARTAGLRVGRGIVVNDSMATSDRYIFAIGDCAEHAGVTGGLVAPAWAQAQVAADVVSGVRPLSRYRPAPVVTRLKAAGVDLATMGESADADPEALTFHDPRRGTYAKLVVRGDRLAGAIMLGDNPSVGTVIQLFDRGGALPADLRSLLLGRAAPGPAAATHEASPALMPDAAVVCRCNTVTKGAIVAGWRAGDRGTAQVAARTRATTGCGGCAESLTGILRWLATNETGTPEEVGA
jgi:assimilatory nitrate reductase electron transfer subunit